LGRGPRGPGRVCALSNLADERVLVSAEPTPNAIRLVSWAADATSVLPTRGRRSIVCPLEHEAHLTLRLPSQDSKVLTKLIALQLEARLPLPASEFLVGYAAHPDNDGIQSIVHVRLLRRSRAEALAAAAGIAPQLIVSEAAVLARSLSELSDDASQPVAALLLREDWMALLAFANGQVLLVRRRARLQEAREIADWCKNELASFGAEFDLAQLRLAWLLDQAEGEAALVREREVRLANALGAEPCGDRLVKPPPRLPEAAPLLACAHAAVALDQSGAFDSEGLTRKRGGFRARGLLSAAALVVLWLISAAVLGFVDLERVQQEHAALSAEADKEASELSALSEMLDALRVKREALLRQDRALPLLASLSQHAPRGLHLELMNYVQNQHLLVTGRAANSQDVLRFVQALTAEAAIFESVWVERLQADPLAKPAGVRFQVAGRPRT
jgi:hypothetical protein